MIDAAEQPQVLDELVRDVDAIARLDFLAEAEEVVDDLEPVLQKVDVEPDAAGRLLHPEAPRERPEALGELQRETESLGRRRRDGSVVRRLVGFVVSTLVSVIDVNPRGSSMSSSS